MKNGIERQKGSILIINILLIVLAAIVALPLMTFFTEGSRSIVVDKEQVRAKYMAYSGIAYGLYKYVEESEASGSYDLIDDIAGFTWDSEVNGGELTITSTGYSEKAMFRLEEEIEVTYAGVPTVTTGEATDIGTTSATLNMTYDFRGYDSGQVRFSYKQRGTSEWLETTWSDESGDDSYSVEVTGLTSNKWYDFYAQLKYDSTVIDGEENSFKTLN